jgi:hypothetical protein
LAWFPSFGTDPNEAGDGSQRPNIWLGEWWLQSKQPHSTDIVTPKDQRLVLRNLQLTKQILHPYELGSGISHNFVFSSSTTMRNYSMWFNLKTIACG